MSAKNKILLSVGAICLVAVVAVVAIVAVFAANQQKFTSSIKVSYTAKEVEGKVMANWYEGSDSASAMKVGGSGSGASEIEFKAGAANQNGTLSPTKETITLSAESQYVVFEYIFTNTGKEYKAVLTYTDDDVADTNVTIYTGYHTEKLNATDIKAGNEQVTLQSKGSGQFIELTVPNGAEEQQEMYAYVVVSISAGGLGKDAGFSGTFSWQLDSTVVTD